MLMSVIDKSVKLDLVGMINYSDKIRDFSISSDIKNKFRKVRLYQIIYKGIFR